MEDVRKELISQEIENFDNKVFIPLATLKSILTANVVASLLKTTDIEFYHHAELTRVITDKALRIFATLIYIGDLSAICRFIEHDHSTQPHLDSKLPFVEDALDTIWDNTSTRKAFCRKQFIFCIPFIEADQSHRHLHERTVLPYLNRIQIGSGGFANVYKVKITAFQHDLDRPEISVEIACKEIRSIRTDTKISFLNETHILSLLRCLQHPNIIRLIMAYTIRDTHNLLFPLAEGDLRKFFTLEERPLQLQKDHDILKALWGLSSAVVSVHNYFADEFDVRKVGCHYDIKPRNILYHDGKFLLSDFGLSRLRDEDEGSRSLFKDIEGNYLAPECEEKENEYQKGSPGRMSDVWSFGCILSEMLTYLCGGPQNVKRYEQERRTQIGPEIGSFFFAAGPQINPAVLKCLNSRLLNGQMTSLAELVQEILRITPEERVSAQHITSSLFRISLQEIVDTICENSEASSLGLDMDVELRRFNIWSEIMGLKPCLNGWILSRETWLSKHHSHKEYSDITMTLYEINQEIRDIYEFAENLEKPTHRYCFHLQRLQDRLWDAQPRHLHDRMNMQLERLLLSEQHIANILQHTLNESRSNKSSEVEQHLDQCTLPRLYQRVKLLNVMQTVSEAIATNNFAIQDSAIPSSELRKPFETFHSHYLSEHLPSRRLVLIEKLVYSESWDNHVDELITRVKSITSLRSTISFGDFEEVQRTFPILECCGYYHQASAHEFGIVYFLPNMRLLQKPLSLWDILNKTPKITQQPSLSSRFTLAAKIVRCVRDLHAVGWFHKSICSQNILIIPTDDEKQSKQFQEIYLIGFNFSRINSDNAFTEGPGIGDDLKDYQHPRYLKAQSSSLADPKKQARRFRPEFDYYSTGLVLLEIGFWKPLKAITRELKGSPSQVMRSLVKYHVELIKGAMGDYYGNAVNACLTCYTTDNVPTSEAQICFERDVVDPIAKRRI